MSPADQPLSDLIALRDRMYDAALEVVRRTGALPVPPHLRNAATAEQKREGFGAEYRYPHDFPHHVVKQQHLPDRLGGARFYEPTDQAEERTIRERLAWWSKKLGS